MKLQEYNSEPVIPGVQIIDLKQHNDDGGSFVELGRFFVEYFSDGIEQGSVIRGFGHDRIEELQINHSVMLKGVIKAFHLHKKQADIFYIMNRCLVGLADLRGLGDNVSKFNAPHRTMRFVAGVTPQLIVVPSGIAHGFAALYGDVNIIYMVNQYFNKEDEFRLSWDMCGKDFWKIKNG